MIDFISWEIIICSSKGRNLRVYNRMNMTDLAVRMAAEIKTGPNILARLQQGPRLEQYYEGSAWN